MSAAAVLLLPSVLLLAALALLVPATASERPHADPVVALWGAAGPWPVVAVALATVAGWWRWLRPTVAELRQAAVLAVAAVAAALLGAVALRLAFGPSLPSFVPAEESARPGMTQGIAAGVLEEVVFRLLLAPAAYFALRGRLGEAGARLGAVLACALGFAAAHELGPGAGAFRADYFATRALLPGAGFTVAFFWIGPAFTVTAHCAAHVVIPLLFR